jgi:hypothetical protein
MKTKLLILVLLFIAATAHADGTFLEEYFVTGVNLDTNERVVGWVDGILGESEVQGHVLDRGHHYAVVGVANGMGSFELRSMCCTYDVVVADEIKEDKIHNRKQWEGSWE